RRDLLRDLLRLTVYERMRQAAREQAAELDGHRKNARATLETQFADVNPEALVELERMLREKRTVNRRSGRDLESADKHLQELRERHSHTRALRVAREMLTKLSGRASDMAKAEKQVTDALRAAPV